MSVEHIRAALQKPAPRLQVPSAGADTPTFHIEVRQPLFVVPPLPEEKPFDPTFGLPSLGELFMGGIQKVGSSVAKYKRGRAERHARRTVDDELAAFCAANRCVMPPAPQDGKPAQP